VGHPAAQVPQEAEQGTLDVGVREAEVRIGDDVGGRGQHALIVAAGGGVYHAPLRFIA